MKVFLVVQDDVDLALLRRLLPAARSADLQIIRGGTLGMRSSVISMAASIRSDDPFGVIALLDARTVDEASIVEQEVVAGDMMRYGGSAVRYELVFAVPEMEVVLFHDRALLERLLEVEMTAEEAVEARFIPGKVLARLIERSRRIAAVTELVGALDDWAARRIAEHPLIRQLEALVADVRANPVTEPELLRRTG